MNKFLPRYIDWIFCLILLPAMITLLPIEQWINKNTSFVLVLVAWLYTVYFLNRKIVIPWLMKSRNYQSGACLVFIGMLYVTYHIGNYHLSGPSFRPDPINKEYRIVRTDSTKHSTRFNRIKEQRRKLREKQRQEFQKRMQKGKLHQQGVWLLFIVVCTFSVAMGLLTELTKQIMARKEAEYEKSKAELALYKAQINPHFLFNTLNTLYALIITKSDKLENAFIQFIDMMRYMYSEANKDQISLSTEIEYIRQYIELQQIRLTECTKIQFSYPEESAIPPLQIAPMLLITFVENAIKYGSSTHEESLIHITIQLKDEHTLCFSTDNPCFTKKESDIQPKEKKGIGIENCRKRLNLLYPNSYSLDILETPTHFATKLTIDLKNEVNHPTNNEKV